MSFAAENGGVKYGGMEVGTQLDIGMYNVKEWSSDLRDPESLLIQNLRRIARMLSCLLLTRPV